MKENFKKPPRQKKDPKMKEVVTLYAPAFQINVRAAKDQLSSLLDLAAQGQDIVITSDGQPKAKLTPYRKRQKPFRVNWNLLRSIPIKRGKSAEEIIREDRDAHS